MTTDQATATHQTEPAVEGPVDPTVKPLCAHCGFALPASGTGVRHYGTHTAHQENECLRLLHAEIARLTAMNQALRQSADTAREIMGRCIVGLNKLDRLARDWEPDHSTGADRQAWVLARDARDDADVWIRTAA